MNDTISTLLTLIPLAIFIGIRMIAERKKRADVEERKRLAESLVQFGATPRKPSGVTTGSESVSGEFSAHSLKPDEDAPKPRFEKERQRSQPSAPELKAPPVAPLFAAETPYAEPPAAKAVPQTAAQQATEGGLFARLNALPPLKRAVVFSELLGTPKGL